MRRKTGRKQAGNRTETGAEILFLPVFYLKIGTQPIELHGNAFAGSPVNASPHLQFGSSRHYQHTFLLHQTSEPPPLSSAT
jgi:hypothetical protein